MIVPNSVEHEKPGPTYVVEPGDTLSGISLKCSISVQLLKKYNHLFGKNDIFVGQVKCNDPLLHCGS